ncbi:hypothetical protein ACFL43_01005 [Thermodesulfobacteriota bacterium]
MLLNIIYSALLAVILAGIVALLLIVRARREGDRMYEKYSSYTRALLADKVTLRPYSVKPEYRTVHPAKALKLIKISIDSNEADTFRRLNILDATMMLCVRMFTCFILPNYNYNLPMLSVDIVFIGGKRVFVIEVIDPAHIEDENIKAHYDMMRGWAPKAEKFEHAKVDMKWCKDIVTDFSIHCKANRSDDDLLFEIYTLYLNAYLEMARNAQPLSPELSARVQQGMEGYVGALLEKGGPAVNVFKFLLGPEKQQEYVRTVMFGVD